MGFLAGPSPTDNVCNVPHRRVLGPNGIISHANRLTDNPACYVRCHNTLRLHRQPRPLSLPCQRSGDPSTHPTRSEEIRGRALMLSRLDGTHERSIALVELRHDKGLLPLRSAAGSHLTPWPHRNLVGGNKTRWSKNDGTYSRP